MVPRIAIPLPTSKDLAYNHLNWSAYAEAVVACGGEPVEFSLHRSSREIADLANTCHAILLPGSPADVNPAKYGHELDPATAPADLPRENVDELLLQDAYNLHKPILGICFGCQILNVWRSGTLIQDLSILPVNHAASRSVHVAHNAFIPTGTVLASIVAPVEAPLEEGYACLPINSSHHQAIGVPGDGLRVVARCPQDSVIEAVEGIHSDYRQSPHFVLGIQWHPERTFHTSSTSHALFTRFIDEARSWTPRQVLTSISRVDSVPV